MYCRRSYTRDIYSIVKAESLATRKDITNTMQSIRKDMLKGRSPIQAIINKLYKLSYEYKVTFNPITSAVQRLFLCKTTAL